MNKKISLKDIANQVGVSIALVSYVLNGKGKEVRVGQDMEEKIRKTAQQLNYQPNFIARSLKSGKTNTIGFIVADISNPFFSNLARIIEDEAKKYGYTVIFGSSDESAEKSEDLIKTLLNRQVDGLIIAPVEHTESQVNILRDNHTPFVLIDRYFPKIKANSVYTNNYAASYDAISQLVKNGYKKIAMLAWNNTLFHMDERVRGYKTALKEHKIKFKQDRLCKVANTSFKSDIARSLKVLIRNKDMDAIFFETNSLAIEGLKQIISLGVKVPDNIGVVSFDETDAFDLFYSPITHIKQNLSAIGREAVLLLLENINRPSQKTKQVIVEAKLIVRKSSERVS